MAHTISWFDLNVRNFDRACTFYRQVLACELQAFSMGDVKCAVFPHQENDVAGCLVENPAAQPANDGLLVYFNVEGRLDQAIAAAVACGGNIVEAKTSIAPHGFRAVVLDSEGNRIGLHSM